MEDILALHRLKNKDIGGLEVLMRKYQVKALRTAFLITHEESLAEDVVQDTFLRIYHRSHQIDETKPFAPYLMRSVINSALNACRDEKHVISLDGSMETVERLISQAASVETQLEYSEMKGEILNALRQLPPRQRAAIVQRYYLGMSEREMSLALDSAPGTIKWLLNSARANLRNLIKKERI